MSLVVLSLGSNINKEFNIRSAIQKLAAEFGDLDISPAYETTAVGFDGPPFLNLVVGMDSPEPVEKIRDALRKIEQESGRVRGKKSFDNRILDIDIILYGDQDYRSEGFNIPRDEIEKYAYVLKPLSDLYPDSLHPVLGRSFIDMWGGFDREGQSLVEIEFEVEI